MVYVCGIPKNICVGTYQAEYLGIWTKINYQVKFFYHAISIY